MTSDAFVPPKPNELFLGTNRVTFLLNTLAPEIIDEDLASSANSVVTKA